MELNMLVWLHVLEDNLDTGKLYSGNVAILNMVDLIQSVGIFSFIWKTFSLDTNV